MRVVSVIQLIAIVILLSGGFSSATQKAADTSRVLAELNAVQNELNAALERDDRARVRSFYAPNFMMRLGRGKTLTLDELDQLGRLAAKQEVLERKHSSVIQKLKLVDSDAILAVDHKFTETHKLKDGQIRKIVQVKRQQERWVKETGDWKLWLVENIETKQSEITVNGQKQDSYLPEHAIPVAPNASDQRIVNDGYGLVFIYRLNDGAVIRTPIFCNEAKVARMTGGSFVKLKLHPGRYALKSEKGDPIDVAINAGDILLLAMKLEAGFPKGRGNLQLDPSVLSAQAYKLPRLLDLTPLGNDNIDDASKVVATP